MELAIWLVFVSLVGAQDVIVNIPELGDVVGSTTHSAWKNRTIYQFFSVKYAESPSGSKRFQPPEAVQPWVDIYNARIPRKLCPQMSRNGYNYSVHEDLEDCLTLSVFTPKLPSNGMNDTLLPVMVYIHGGAFIRGGSICFPPHYLLEDDVLLVVPQYRLGALGFLSLQTDKIPGNAGFLDQLLALRWVNKYIKNFGGDNTQVTIVGQSAGACSIALHLMSPIVEPFLFQKAILLSASAFADWSINNDPVSSAKLLFKSLYKYLPNKLDDLENVNISVMEEAFINAPLADFMSASSNLYKTDPDSFTKLSTSVIQTEGRIKYLTESHRDILKSGKMRTLPLLLGVTKHDGSFLVTEFYNKLESQNLQDDDQFLRNNVTEVVLAENNIVDNTNTILDIFNKNYFNRLFEKGKKITFKDVAPGLIDMYGVLGFKGQILKHAKINANHRNDTFLYTLDYRGEHTRFGFGQDTKNLPFDGGVHHSDDLLYLFPYSYTLPLNQNDTKMAKMISGLWTSFAINGYPNSPLLNITWDHLIKGKNGPYLHIDSTSYIGNDFVASEYNAATREAIE